ncbi:MAG: hypothetical protein VKK42_09230 [Lyngbya sp.]|nr:hypothetical protein [Lyngbya sp.]
MDLNRLNPGKLDEKKAIWEKDFCVGKAEEENFNAFAKSQKNMESESWKFYGLGLG